MNKATYVCTYISLVGYGIFKCTYRTCVRSPTDGRDRFRRAGARRGPGGPTRSPRQCTSTDAKTATQLRSTTEFEHAWPHGRPDGGTNGQTDRQRNKRTKTNESCDGPMMNRHPRHRLIFVIRSPEREYIPVCVTSAGSFVPFVHWIDDDDSLLLLYRYHLVRSKNEYASSVGHMFGRSVRSSVRCLNLRPSVRSEFRPAGACVISAGGRIGGSCIDRTKRE